MPIEQEDNWELTAVRIDNSVAMVSVAQPFLCLILIGSSADACTVGILEEDITASQRFTEARKTCASELGRLPQSDTSLGEVLRLMCARDWATAGHTRGQSTQEAKQLTHELPELGVSLINGLRCQLSTLEEKVEKYVFAHSAV